MLKWTYTSDCREFAPRTIVLQKGRSGFGFVLRGAKGEFALVFTKLQMSKRRDGTESQVPV